MRTLLCWLKKHAARWMLVIEYCHDCGIRQPLVWWSDNALWSEVTGEQPCDGDNMPGIYCPECFDRRASAKGLLLQWHPTVMHRKEQA